MLGLPEFRLLEAVEVDGGLELTVETAAVGWCRVCGVRAKGRYDTLVRDVSAFGRRVQRWWRCPESARGWHRLGAALAIGDPDGEVTAAWQLKEITRDLYLAAARQVLDLLYSWPIPAASLSCAACPHGPALGGRGAGLAHHRRREQRPTEAVNLSIKQIKRVGRGFTNFDNYRLRLLLHCGGVNWQTQPAARLRGRGPQMAV